MGLQYDHLDETTRKFMLEEIDFDVQHGSLYLSPRLHDAGCASWPSLLREAATSGTDETLAAAVRRDECFHTHMQRAKPKGGFTTAAVPYNAPETLAEGEFNRFYIRGLCRRAMEEGIPYLVACRAKQVERPRAESEALIGNQFDPGQVLADLRANTGVDTAFGLPAGPNSGLCLTLP